MAYDAADPKAKPVNGDGSVASDIVRFQTQMENERANWDNLYRQIGQYVFPRGDLFNTTMLTQGQLRGEKVFDNTPTLALDHFGAALDSLITPRTEKWHGLRCQDEAMNDIDEVREYLESVRDILFAARYSPHANFASQMHEFYLSLGAFGTAAIFIDDDMGTGLRYRALHLSELYITENFQGKIDRVHRKFSLSARQAAQQFGYDNLPEPMQKCLEKPGQEMTPFDFLHCVCPNEEIDERRMDHKGMAFCSYYVAAQAKMIVQMGGYRTMPYAVGRYVTGPRETYGRSPAMTVLRDIMSLNEMGKLVLREGQLHTSPPILLNEDGALQAFQMRPGYLNYGMLSDDGEPLAKAMRPEGDMQIGLELIQDKRKGINDAFLISLFQILVENPNQTATEALLRAQEKGQLLGPTLGRQQSETLGIMIEREIDILSMAGQLPPMPDVLKQAHVGIDVEYTSPLNRLQKSDEAVGILRLIEAAGPLAQIDPGVLKIIDTDKAFRQLANSFGTPAKVIRSEDEMASIRDEEAQKAQTDQLLAAAPVVASTIKDLSQAQATGANVPQPIPQIAPAAPV